MSSSEMVKSDPAVLASQSCPTKHGTFSGVRTLRGMGGDLEETDEVLWKLVVNGYGDAFGALFDVTGTGFCATP